MPVSSQVDGLSQSFPIHGPAGSALKLSRQAESFLRDLERYESKLRARGFTFGHSRLAVQVGPQATHSGCIYCGQCMNGCVYGLIYNASTTVEQLSVNPRFKYVSGLAVDQLFETSSSVEIAAYSIHDGQPVTFSGEKVFVACGVLESTRLLLRSLSMYDTDLTMKDACYFLLPLLRFSGTPNVQNEALHTLAQLFLEVDDPAISPHTIHLQVYTYNELFRRAAQNLLGKSARLMRSPLDQLLGRTLLLQGYSHSHHSDTISVRLKQPTKERPLGVLSLEAKHEADSSIVVSKVIKKLRQSVCDLRALPLSPLLRVGQPGRGFHAGGTFPMRQRPTHCEADSLGRPAGLKRIHVVDASVFPSVPATTITYTVMANAHRIGTQALQA